MAINYIGVAAVWGHGAAIDASGASPSGCLGTILIQSAKFKRDATKFDIMDKVGTVGRIAADPKEILTIEGIYTGTTLADAQGQAAKTPSIGNTVKIADATTVADTEINGLWSVADAEKSLDVKSPRTISLTLERFPDSAAMNGTTMTRITA